VAQARRRSAEAAEVRNASKALDSYLRRVMQRVHPDLLASRSDDRVQHNMRSLQYLQSMLTALDEAIQHAESNSESSPKLASADGTAEPSLRLLQSLPSPLLLEFYTLPRGSKASRQDPSSTSPSDGAPVDPTTTSPSTPSENDGELGHIVARFDIPGSNNDPRRRWWLQHSIASVGTRLRLFKYMSVLELCALTQVDPPAPGELDFLYKQARRYGLLVSPMVARFLSIEAPEADTTPAEEQQPRDVRTDNNISIGDIGSMMHELQRDDLLYSSGYDRRSPLAAKASVAARKYMEVAGRAYRSPFDRPSTWISH